DPHDLFTLHYDAPRASSIASFLSDGDHRALPSFPTRRSSDLGFLVVVTLLDDLRVRACQDRHVELCDSLLEPEALEALDRGLKRSEEHTSELQSRENLVCRLLLEKKKTERIIKSNAHQKASNN